jgi:hypothetical protein
MADYEQSIPDSVHKNYFCLFYNVQTGSEANPNFYPMVTGGFFPRDKATGVRRCPLTSFYWRSQESWSCTSTTLYYIFVAWCLTEQRDSLLLTLPCDEMWECRGVVCIVKFNGGIYIYRIKPTAGLCLGQFSSFIVYYELSVSAAEMKARWDEQRLYSQQKKKKGTRLKN